MTFRYLNKIRLGNDDLSKIRVDFQVRKQNSTWRTDTFTWIQIRKQNSTWR